ncbi:hypothetical protein KM924_15990 [Brevibacillus parabrevis]|uniref:hypothetical protein n=1 Tax=Brevibacillus parabrevis TaxID=54914 RepID=UPI001C24C6C3|nr:hypothetical protein [Brevibacillus parabrevis]MBU8714013.1 hypothetical protein [Brevibacillus parabrevis]
MEKRKRFGWAVILACVLIAGGAGPALAEEVRQPQQQPGVFEEIQIKRQDVTGDGKPDVVTLLGQRFAADSPYFEKLKVMVQDPVAKKTTFFTTAYGGYQPDMAFCDFIGNGTKQILVQAPTGGSGGTSDFYLFSNKDNKPVVLPVPQPLTISGSYQDNYKVPILIKETNQTTVLDLSDRKKIYEENGVYKNGKLVTPTDVMPNSFSVLAPVDENRDGICELKGVQRVSGVANADTIAYVESLWKWDKTSWKLQKAEVKKAEM